MDTINYYKGLDKNQINIKICLLDRKGGYTEHAWRFYEMAKIAEGKMFLTFADDLIINTKHWESQACFSPDGNYLYFVSNRPGGFGGKDIWKSKIENNTFI